jgi:O-antigen ligase
MIRSLRFAPIPLFLMLCIFLGGSSRGLWGNMALQLIAIVILAWASMTRRPMELPRSGTILLCLAASAIALIALQLVPLPPAIWTGLPGRQFVADGYALLGQPLPWLPISLAPYQTLASALWLLPPLAILAGMLRLGAFRTSWLAGALAVAAFAAVLVGALQVTSGDPLASPWYFYRVTNYGSATGFFANSNHMASLLVVTIPFLMALFGSRWTKSAQASASKTAILAGGLLVVLLGLVLNGSLAGWGLGLPVLAASALLRVPMKRTWARWSLAGVAVLSLAAVALIFSSPMQKGLPAAGAGASLESRAAIFKTSLKAASEFAPLGSGVGTFAEIYPRYEDPASIWPTFANHAHSDFIEILLETGVAGLILVALFLIWWIGRVVAIWRSPTVDQFARAATIASAAILAHSLVDYPLRMTAISAIFAMCLALMVRPRRGTIVEPAQGEQKARHLSVG